MNLRFAIPDYFVQGGMVSGISLEGKDLLKIPSKRRNPILVDIFSRLKYMERRGNGLKKIPMISYAEVDIVTTER